MRQFVESMKRLYRKNKVTNKKIQELVAAQKITEEEARYIKG